MRILSFDTSTDACSVALCCGERVFARFEVAPRLHAQKILLMVQSVLTEANLTLSQLNAIAYGAGPGSFMGVRLATGIAQGLSFGSGVPLIPISTLQTIAQAAYEKNGAKKVVAGWDARMQEIYWGFYSADEKSVMQVVKADALCTPESVDIASMLALGSDFAGNAWDLLDPDLFGERKIHSIYPDAKAMLTIAQSKYLNREIVSPENAHPCYLRHHVVHNHK